MKQILYLSVVGLVVVVGGVLWTRAFSQDDLNSPNVLSSNGIHWHPQIEIYIKGEKVDIPENVGLVAGHNPIHTHDDLPNIHLEFGSRVTKEDVQLGKFFEVWGKQFSEECIFNFCNGKEGSVRMFVNGTENFDFENYVMQDGDKIEIRYE